MGRVKYSQFAERIDVHELCNDLGWTPEYEDHKGNLVGFCMFPGNHTNGDTTGKFAIHPEKRVYNCYVCGGGDLLSLVMELNSWDHETSEDYLRQFAGDGRDDVEFVEDFLAAFAKDTEKRVETLPYFNPRVLEKLEHAYGYGEMVGLTAKVIEQYDVRWNPQAFKRSPQTGKMAEEDDYVGPAVLFPHYWNDRLVGWQSRWMDDDRPQWVKKWTNTTDFPKDSTLYGWSLLERGTKLFVVESAKSVLKFRQIGYSAVGTFGSMANDPQLRLLRRFQHGVVLCADNDKAGEQWFTQIYDYLKRYVPLYGLLPVTGSKADIADLPDDEAAAHVMENIVDLSVPSM